MVIFTRSPLGSLAGGAVAGIAWYEERAAKLADRDRTR
jgi:hypothetical protein